MAKPSPTFSFSSTTLNNARTVLHQAMASQVNGNGRVYTASAIKDAYQIWQKFKSIQEISHDYMVSHKPPRTHWWTFNLAKFDLKKDKVAEILPREKRLIMTGVRGDHFDFCTLDRWFNPDCIPGIVSFICDGDDISAYLFSEERYIQLFPTVEVINKRHYLYEQVTTHFDQRGLDHISDSWANTQKWEEFKNDQERSRRVVAGDRSDHWDAPGDEAYIARRDDTYADIKRNLVRWDQTTWQTTE